MYSPTDARYAVKELEPYLSISARERWKLRIELGWLEELDKKGVLPESPPKLTDADIEGILADAKDRESITHHDTGALIESLRDGLPEKIRPYVHKGLCSSDICDTAVVVQWKLAFQEVILYDVISVAEALARLSRTYANTPQIGRTHGRHAELITFGFSVAGYLDRWCMTAKQLFNALDGLQGKLSGPVGTYNHSKAFITDPVGMESRVLEKFGLDPQRIGSQIVRPEQTLDITHYVMSLWGILANIADDFRHLMRDEIDEISFDTTVGEIGSSSMPHKINPSMVENIKSSWKLGMPRIITAYMDQISEHQRDLTNSMTQRYWPELLVLFTFEVRRMGDALDRLHVNEDSLNRNILKYFERHVISKSSGLDPVGYEEWMSESNLGLAPDITVEVVNYWTPILIAWKGRLNKQMLLLALE